MILSNKKNKIALIGYRLGIGGAEKALANLSIFFDKKGIEVHNIIVLDEVSYIYAGKLLNLGKLKNDSNSFINKVKRMLFLRKYLHENKFDYIIDFRPRTKYFQEFLIAKWLYPSKVVFSVRSYLINYYMPNWTFLTQIMYGKSFKIITITNLTQQLIESKHKLKNVQTIYNPIIFDDIITNSTQKINLDFDYIIGVGQMEDNIKQFDKLINAYANSNLHSRNIHLVLLGDGKRKIILESIAKKRNVADKVCFLGHQNNPLKYMAKAKYLVLTSLNEGLPNVILESLACETPVIAFDCPTGPREIIIDKENGILVENQNLEKLTEAINLLFENSELYNYCKKNARQSVAHFSLEIIGQKWLDLMNIN